MLAPSTAWQDGSNIEYPPGPKLSLGKSCGYKSSCARVSSGRSFFDRCKKVLVAAESFSDGAGSFSLLGVNFQTLIHKWYRCSRTLTLFFPAASSVVPSKHLVPEDRHFFSAKEILSIAVSPITIMAMTHFLEPSLDRSKARMSPEPSLLKTCSGVLLNKIFPEED